MLKKITRALLLSTAVLAILWFILEFTLTSQALTMMAYDDH
jgi:hypothetical protein